MKAPKSKLRIRDLFRLESNTTRSPHVQPDRDNRDSDSSTGVGSNPVGSISAAPPLCHTELSRGTGRGGKVGLGQLVRVALQFMGRACGFSTPQAEAVAMVRSGLGITNKAKRACSGSAAVRQDSMQTHSTKRGSDSGARSRACIAWMISEPTRSHPAIRYGLGAA